MAVVVLWGNLWRCLPSGASSGPVSTLALMSNPVLASLVDVTGIVAYFAIAKVLLL